MGGQAGEGAVGRLSPLVRLSCSRRRLALAIAAMAASLPACSRTVSKEAAVSLAEAFVARNGYTNLPRDRVAAALDPESFELGASREEQLQMRFNTLKPKAIGVQPGQKGEEQGWSVAFDFTDAHADSSTCRVVTMDSQGQHLVMQHVDGTRSYFAVLDEKAVRTQLRQ